MQPPKYNLPYSKFFGIPDQDIDLSKMGSDLAPSTKAVEKRRFPGLSQEYIVRKPRHQPEPPTFKPQITRYNPESELRKRKQAQRLLRGNTSHDKAEQLRSLIKSRLNTSGGDSPRANIASEESITADQLQSFINPS